MDSAIELASASLHVDEPSPASLARRSSALADGIAGLAAGLQGVAKDVRAAWSDVARMASALSAVAADLAELRAAVAAAAALGNGGQGEEGLEGSAMPMRALLDHAAGPARSWIVAEARFLAKRGAGPGWTTWEFEARVVGGEGAPKHAARPTFLVSIGPERSDGRAALLGRREPMVFACRREGRGWSVSARTRDASGKLGEEFAALEFR